MQLNVAEFDIPVSTNVVPRLGQCCLGLLVLFSVITLTSVLLLVSLHFSPSYWSV